METNQCIEMNLLYLTLFKNTYEMLIFDIEFVRIYSGRI